MRWWVICQHPSAYLTLTTKKKRPFIHKKKNVCEMSPVNIAKGVVAH